MVSEKGPFNTLIRGDGYWQARICDLAACMAKTHLHGPPARFNLTLRDPIEKYLDADAPWRGTSGEYVIALGPESSAEPGSDPALPTLDASVGAFTRMWLGVRPATGLAVTDDLDGPPRTAVRAGPDPAPARAGHVRMGVLGKRSGKKWSIQANE